MKTIYFLGPEGSFSHIITKNVFPDEKHIGCNTFFEIANRIRSDKNSIGIFPIENSITSDVHENVDYIFKNPDFNIIGEAVLKINLYLYGLPGSTPDKITTVYSHPKALAQCIDFIKSRNLEMVECASTAEAKNIIIADKNIRQACIGSKELQDTDVTLLEKNIGNAKNNYTRFIFVTTSKTGEAKNKATFIFKVKHEPGTLAKILSQLAGKGLNLTKIESRPLPDTYWEYMFWVDVEIPNNVSLAEVEKIIKNNCLSYRLAGSYGKGKMYES